MRKVRILLHTIFFLFVLLFSNCTLNKKNYKFDLDFVTPEMFGAKGDGFTDDTNAFNKAISSLKKGRFLKLDNRSYFINSKLNPFTNSINIIGSKTTTIICPNGFIDFKNEPLKFKYYIDKIHERSNKFILENLNPQIQPGDLVFFYNDELYEEQLVHYTKSHANVVDEIKGKEINLNYRLGFSFKKPVNINFYSKDSITIKNIHFKANSPLNIITATYYTSINLKNLNFSTIDKRLYGIYPAQNLIGTSGISLFSCTNISVDKCNFDYLWYGLLAHKGCTNINMKDCSAFKAHHLNNSGLGADLFVIIDCIAQECESGFDSHETAINLTLINCKDINGSLPTTLRGRRDIVMDCYFDKGIEMKYDKHSLPLFKDEIVEKSFINSVSKGPINHFQGSNILLQGSTFSQSVVFSNNYGVQKIIDCQFIEEDIKMPVRSELLTIGDVGWDDQPYKFMIKNCIIKALKSSSYKMGLYLPMTGKVEGTIENLTIDGFEKGLIMYGGAKALPSYENLYMNNITIQNCALGIYQSPLDITVNKAHIKFVNCLENVDTKYKLLNSENSVIK